MRFIGKSRSTITWIIVILIIAGIWYEGIRKDIPGETCISSFTVISYTRNSMGLAIYFFAYEHINGIIYKGRPGKNW